MLPEESPTSKTPTGMGTEQPIERSIPIGAAPFDLFVLGARHPCPSGYACMPTPGLQFRRPRCARAGRDLKNPEKRVLLSVVARAPAQRPRQSQIVIRKSESVPWMFGVGC